MEEDETTMVGDETTMLEESPTRARLEEGASTSGEQSGIQPSASTSQEDSEEEMFDFELTPHVDRRVRKFGLHMRNYTARITQRGGGDLTVPLGQRPVLAREISEALQRAIERHIIRDETVRDNDHLLININSNRLQNAYHSVRLRVRDWRDNNLPAQEVLQQITNMLNSNENFTMDDTFNMNISHVRDPGTGSTSRDIKLGLDPIEKILKEKKAVVQIKNTDDLCCARALVTAQAYRNFGSQHPRYRGLKKGGQEQTEAARDLHRAAGVPEGPCGLDQITLFQSHLRDYQIVVVSVQHGYQIIYKGPEKPETKRLVLIKHGEHYHTCNSLKGFFGRSYYCLRCETGYDSTSRHNCPGTKCFACHQTNCTDYRRGGTADFPCVDCRRSFFGERCHQLHKARQSGNGKPAEYGKRNSVCHTHKKCIDCRKIYSGYEIKNGHRCGFNECPSCKKYHDLRTHKCFIQNPEKIAEERRRRKRRRDGTPSTPAERDPPIFVSWDAEAMQEDGQHVPNLICAMTSDTETEYQFEGESCVVEFLTWLRRLAEENDIIAVAHNFKGYDSYFILEELYRQAVCPDQVVNGAKIISMTIPGIVFKDSMCFMQMALSAFPKAFGLTEQKKGFFPHFFNKRENQNYVGPIPARDYYDPEGMTKERKAEFEVWYQERVDEDYEFDFQQELLAYCKSDVKLLHEGCRIFRSEFQDIAGFDPMEKCLTIASACSRYYNTQCLKEDTLASEPLRGWHGKGKPHSRVSLEWLHYLDSRSPTRIQHARNGGECEIILRGHSAYVDGKDGDTVYEFYGCFFHGCPDCFPNRDRKYSLLSVRSMREVYEETRCRAAVIRAAGYTLVEMWECQWTKLKKEDSAVKTFVDSLDLVTRLEPREAFFGGRTNAVKLYDKTEDQEQIHYVDFTSLYPWVNKTCVYPQGHPTIVLEPGHTDVGWYFGLVKCTVSPPYGLYSPVLPYRHGGKLTFPLCRSCVETEQSKPLTERTMTCNHTKQERQLTGTWCTPEIMEAVRQGYVVDHIYEVWHFPQRSDELFKKYVNTFLQMKQEASGWPSWTGEDPDKRLQYVSDFYAKEGIQLNVNNIQKNPGRRSLAKMMLNSFWGKYGQQGNKPQVETFTSPADFYSLLRDESVIITDLRVVNPEMLEIVHKKRDACENIQANVNIFVACFTTCYARLKLYQDGLSRLKPEQILYFDTDSLIYKRAPTDPVLPLGDFLGDFTDELEVGDHITEFAAAGPKNYGYRTSQGKVCCKVRGFSLNVRGSVQLNFETLKDNVLSEVREPLDVPRDIPVFNPHKITRDKKNKTLNTVTEIKRYKVVFDKRVVDPETMASYPYGYARNS
ncbi:hypothetical protein ACROYT_G033710 [Oculina patagonica]